MSICVVGSLNVDVGYRVATMPTPGETVLGSDRTRSFGGKGGNQAVAAAALGGRVSFVGAVGDDEPARLYLEHLRRLGIDIDGVATLADAPTGEAVVLVDDVGENLIVVVSGANGRLEPEEVAARVRAAEAEVVLAQLEVPVAALEAAAAVLPKAATLVLNPAPMPPLGQGLERLLERVDVLVPNRSELGLLLGRAEPRTLEQVRACLNDLAFHGVVVVTLGADGAVVSPPHAPVQHVPAPAVDPVDTTGAGDAFCGALAVGLSRGQTVLDSVCEAVHVAARSTLHRGAQLVSSADAPPAVEQP
ncbi:MAG: ribokinase [Humibacillus sp.]|nr:ribokinase [Humibacillus sp.]